ncbi:MAG: TIR domain-containing protein [Hyphomonadaceae bacterium]
MTDVFISYARADRKRARQFAKAFEAEGFDVWWDQSASQDGAWTPALRRALVDAAAVVTLWSEEAAASSWVSAEAAAAHDRRAFLPVRIGPGKIPAAFAALPTPDFTRWRADKADPDWSALVQQARDLVKAKHAAQNSPLPPPPPQTLRAPPVQAQAKAAAQQPPPQTAQVYQPNAFFSANLGAPRQQGATARATPLPVSPPAQQPTFSPVDEPLGQPPPIQRPPERPADRPIERPRVEPIQVRLPEPQQRQESQRQPERIERPQERPLPRIVRPVEEPPPVRAETRAPIQDSEAEEPPKRKGGGAGLALLVLLLIGGGAAAYVFRDSFLPAETQVAEAPRTYLPPPPEMGRSELPAGEAVAADDLRDTQTPEEQTPETAAVETPPPETTARAQQPPQQQQARRQPPQQTPQQQRQALIIPGQGLEEGASVEEPTLSPQEEATRSLERCLGRLVRLCPGQEGGRAGFTEDGAISQAERALLGRQSLFATPDDPMRNAANCTRHLNAAQSSANRYEPLTSACAIYPLVGPPR